MPSFKFCDHTLLSKMSSAYRSCKKKKKNNCHFRVDKLKKFALFLKVCGIWFTVYMQVVQCMWNISLPWVTGKHNKEKSNSIWKQWTKVLGRGSASANFIYKVVFQVERCFSYALCTYMSLVRYKLYIGSWLVSLSCALSTAAWVTRNTSYSYRNYREKNTQELHAALPAAGVYRLYCRTEAKNCT